MKISSAKVSKEENKQPIFFEIPSSNTAVNLQTKSKLWPKFVRML